MVDERQWAAPQLEQVVEITQGVLPREFDSWDEIPGRMRDLLPTPTANQYEQDNDVLLARREREKAKHRNGNGFGLTTANALALLPTPTGDDANNVTRASGEYRSLARETHALLPTPQAADGSGGRMERSAAANGWKRPSGAKAAKPLGTAIGLLGEPTDQPSADGSRSSDALPPDQLTIGGD